MTARSLSSLALVSVLLISLRHNLTLPGRGIGSGIAKELAARGAAVVVNYANSPAAAEEFSQVSTRPWNRSVSAASRRVRPAANAAKKRSERGVPAPP